MCKTAEKERESNEKKVLIGVYKLKQQHVVVNQSDDNFTTLRKTQI